MILWRLAIVEAWIEAQLVEILYRVLKPIAEWKDRRW